VVNVGSNFEEKVTVFNSVAVMPFPGTFWSWSTSHKLGNFFGFAISFDIIQIWVKSRETKEQFRFQKSRTTERRNNENSFYIHSHIDGSVSLRALGSLI
jgi:hypothetical protein